MKYLACILTFLFINTALFAQLPPFKWAKGMSGPGTAFGCSVTTDKWGNVYTTGRFSDTIDFDPGPGVFKLFGGTQAIFISKLNAAGEFKWAKHIGASSVNNSWGIATDNSANVYTTGSFNQTSDFDPGPGTFELTANGIAPYVLKLDSLGNFVWAKAFTGIVNQNVAYAITVDAPGNVYTTGMFSGNVDFDPGPGVFNFPAVNASDDVFICKLTTEGNFAWAKRIRGELTDKSYAICHDLTGNIYVTGTLGTYGWSSDPINTALDQSGFDFQDSLFVTKLNSAGDFLWTKYMVTDSTAEAHGIGVDKSGNVYSTGRFQGTLDFDPGAATYNITAEGNENIYISKLDASGDFVWVKTMHGPAIPLWNYSSSLAINNSGNVFITGYFPGSIDLDPGVGVSLQTSHGNFDIFIASLDSDGNFTGATGIGDNSLDYGVGITADDSNNIYITGIFNGTPDFDPGNSIYNLTGSTGFGSVFVLKLEDTSVVPADTIINACDLKHSMKLYPNPFGEKLNIENEQNDCRVTLRIYNVAGQLILKNELIPQGHSEIKLPALANGLYFFKFRSDSGEIYTVPIIKKNPG